jgi:uncharacterized spore protein YtfJ
LLTEFALKKFMENINFLENLALRLSQSASVKNVYGEPVITGDKIIIPVAKIMYGFGGGYGQKPKKFIKQENVSNGDTDEKKNNGEGLGGGGGIIAVPKGVYQISKCGTKFIPANKTKLLIAMVLTGFLMKGLIHRRRR